MAPGRHLSLVVLFLLAV